MVAKRGSQKRAAAAPASPAKRAKKADPYFEGVIEAVETSDLPEDVKAMLVAAVPGSCGVFAEERVACQQSIVDMLGRVVRRGREAHEEAARGAAEEVRRVEASKDSAGSEVACAEAAMAAAAEALDGKKNALADASKKVVEAKDSHANAVKEEKGLDKEIAAAEKEKAKFEGAVSDHFTPLEAGELEKAAAAKHYKALLPVIKQCGLDESLQTALQSSCQRRKEERKDFDGTVFAELGKSLRGRVEACAEACAGLAEARPAREALVKSTSEVCESLEAARSTATQEMDDAQVALRAAEDAFAAAKKNAANFEPRLKAAQKAQKLADDSLQNFVAWNVECFTSLRDKAAPPSEPQEPDAPAGGAEAEAVAEAIPEAISEAVPEAVADAPGVSEAVA